MNHIVHCADLHLSDAERDYSLTVLDQVLGHAGRGDVDVLVLAGDVFDSWQDAEALRAEFRRRVLPVAESKPVLLIAGNHERLGAGGQLDRLDLGCPVYEQRPFKLVRFADIEFLILPFQESYSDYLSWEAPAPKGEGVRFRIAVAHGTLAGSGFAGTQEESEAAIDPDLLIRFDVDYAALGHIHAGRIETLGPTIAAYPGSARVWRRGETGPRRFLLLSLAQRIEPHWVEIPAAGVYRRQTVPLDLDGAVPDRDRLSSEWGPRDWVDLELTGLLETEHAAAELERDLLRSLGGKVRRLSVLRDEILVVDGVATAPIARRFLDLWRKRRPQDPREQTVWLRARELALQQIKNKLEARA